MINNKEKLTLSRIDLVFENCEHCTIPVEYIDNLILTNFDQTINYSSWNKFNIFNKCILETLVIDKAFLLESHSYMGDTLNEDKNLYERITDYHDIVCIELFYIEGNTEHTITYYFPWNEEDDYYNKFQNHTENDTELIISIKE